MIKPTKTRRISKFAIIPVIIGKDVRWMQRVALKQTWYESGTPFGGFWKNDAII